MSSFAIVNYLTSSGSGTSWSFQNFFVGQPDFAPFGLTGRGSKKGGDRGETSLVLGNDPISLNFATESVQNRHIIRITTVLLEGASLTTGPTLTNEIWLAASMEIDVEKIVVRLASPLDAVRAQFPRRQLSSSLVGSLPITGNLVIS
jgi:hypothetical protein